MKNRRYKNYLTLGILIAIVSLIVILFAAKPPFINFLFSKLTGNDYVVKFQEIQLANESQDDGNKTCWFFTDFPHINSKVIRTQSEYKSFLREINPSCADSGYFVEIDFSKNTLLANFESGGGCSTNFNRVVIRNDRQKRVNYTVYPISEGACGALQSNYNWTLVPSIPSDYTVNFDLTGN